MRSNTDWTLILILWGMIFTSVLASQVVSDEIRAWRLEMLMERVLPHHNETLPPSEPQGAEIRHDLQTRLGTQNSYGCGFLIARTQPLLREKSNANLRSRADHQRI